MKRSLGIAIGFVGAAALAALGAWYWWQEEQRRLPDYIASGNGRIEAEEIHVATKYAGRIQDVLVEEADFVEAGQVLAHMDTRELQATLARGKADVARSREAVAEAEAQINLRASELKLAEQNLNRALYLVEKGHVSQELADERRSARDTARAALAAAKAHKANEERAVESALAEVSRIETQIDEATLKAPRSGRVQYRLAEPGEVLAAGGKIVTLLDLTDVYMTIFLPTTQVGRVLLGSESRIIIDAAPQYVIPASVSFVAARAQFTPREVETRTEREKLMFRVKVRIPAELLKQHSEKVKTGLPGEAFVLLQSDAVWPDRLAVKLPPADGE